MSCAGGRGLRCAHDITHAARHATPGRQVEYGERGAVIGIGCIITMSALSCIASRQLPRKEYSIADGLRASLRAFKVVLCTHATLCARGNIDA